MGKLVRTPAKKILKKLAKAGFVEIRQRGSHVYLRSVDGARVVVVPVHGSRDVPVGTLYNIVVRQAGLSAEEFNEL